MIDAKDDLIFNVDGQDVRVFPRTLAEQVDGICRSITFGISADYTASAGDLVLNKTFASGSPDYRDADTSLASLSSGKVLLKKTGRYLAIFNGHLTIQNPTYDPQFQVYCPQKNMNIANAAGSLWAGAYKGNVAGTSILDAGNTINCIINCLGASSYGFKAGDTFFSLIYLGEK